MITKNLPTLQIQKLTKKQFETGLENNSLNDESIYLTPVEIKDYALKSDLNTKADLIDNKIPEEQIPDIYLPKEMIGSPNGVATLDAEGKVPSAQLPEIKSGVSSWNDLTDKPFYDGTILIEPPTNISEDNTILSQSLGEDLGGMQFSFVKYSEAFATPEETYGGLIKVNHNGKVLDFIINDSHLNTLNNGFVLIDQSDTGFFPLVINVNSSGTTILPTAGVLGEDLVFEVANPGAYFLYIEGLGSVISYSNAAFKQLDTKFIPDIYLKTAVASAPNGVATLDDAGKIPLAQIPDDIVDLSDYYTKTEVDEEINSVNEGFNAELSKKADLVDGKITVEQIPDDIGGLTEVAWEDIQNKPFYVTGYKVEWNGKPTEEYVDDLFDIAGIMLYKVGEPITKEALVGSTATAYMDGNDVSFAIPQEFIIDMTETGFLIMDPSSGAAFGGVTFGADAFDLSPLDMPVVLEMPSAGLWFLSDGNNNYIKSITSSDYDCKQLDPRVIPANLDFDLSDYYTKEEMDAITGDIETVLNEITVLIGE